MKPSSLLPVLAVALCGCEAVAGIEELRLAFDAAGPSDLPSGAGNDASLGQDAPGADSNSSPEAGEAADVRGVGEAGRDAEAPASDAGTDAEALAEGGADAGGAAADAMTDAPEVEATADATSLGASTPDGDAGGFEAGVDACKPVCTLASGGQKVCGSDGCAGSCGSCVTGTYCNPSGSSCEAPLTVSFSLNDTNGSTYYCSNLNVTNEVGIPTKSWTLTMNVPENVYNEWSATFSPSTGSGTIRVVPNTANGIIGPMATDSNVGFCVSAGNASGITVSQATATY